MLISKKQLTCNMTSKNKSRLVLRHIFFTEDGAVSSDGSSMMIVPYPQTDDKGFYSSVEIRQKAQTADPDPVMIHVDDAACIAGSMKGLEMDKHNHQEPMAALTDIIEGQPTCFTVLCNDFDSHKAIKIARPAVGDYPQHEHFFESREGDIVIRLNLKILLRLLKNMSAASGHEYIDVSIKPPEPGHYDPVKLETVGSSDKPPVRAVIMPAFREEKKIDDDEKRDRQ